MREAEALRLAEEKLKMSSVLQQGLPRPTVVVTQQNDPEPISSEAEKQVREEMLVLLTHDNRTHPLKGMKASRLPKLGRDKEQYEL